MIEWKKINVFLVNLGSKLHKMDHVLFKILNVWSLGLKDATNVLKDTELIKMVDVNMLMNTVGTSVSKVTAPTVTDCIS